MTDSPPALRWGLPALLLLAAFASLLMGPAGLPPMRVLQGLVGMDEGARLLVWELRLPRLALALGVGAGLGATGAALQALWRNPLADPGLLGVSSSGALGAVVVFYSGLSTAWPLALPLGGLAGALLGTLALLPLARRHGALSLLLGGVALGTLASALTSLALSLVPNPYAAYDIVFWLMGSVADRSQQDVGLALPLILCGLLVLWRSAVRLDALALGEEVAASLGVDLAHLQRALVVGSALAVGPGVAVAGFVGFVGLVVPHLLRPLLGHRPSLLVPWSAIAGALLAVLADVACRLGTGPELRLGVMTSLVGAPFLLWLMWRSVGQRPA